MRCVEEAIVPDETELNDRLNRLLVETVEAFLSDLQNTHCGLAGAAGYEIALAVCRRSLPHSYTS